MKEREITNNKSTCPISTILYHDVIDGKHSDLETELNEAIKIFTKLYPNGEYLYIRHKGENGKSDHIHLLLRNNTSNGFNNVNKLRSDVFFETCKVATDQYNIGASKPCANFRTSLIGDWLGYALHSGEYLKFIGSNYIKEFRYELSDVKGSEIFKSDCFQALNEILHGNQRNSKNITPSEQVYQMIDEGFSDMQILNKCKINVNEINSTLKGIRSIRRIYEDERSEVSFERKVRDVCGGIIIQLRERGLLDKVNVEILADVSTHGKGTYSQIDIVHMLFKRFMDNLTEQDIIDMILND